MTVDILILTFFIEGQVQARAQVLWPIAYTLIKEGAGDVFQTGVRETT